MCDEKVEGRAGEQPGGGQRPAPKVGPGDGDGNTDDRAPRREGGQPAVGDGEPRNTEF